MAGQIFEKVMKSRGPGKRQIKPAKRGVSLDDIPDYASTSSDDVDFKIDASELETSDSGSKEQQSDSESSSSQSSRSAAEAVAAESSSSESESESATPKKTGTAKKQAKTRSPTKVRIKREVPAARSTVPKVQNRSKRSLQSAGSKRPCCVCLCSQELNSGAKPLLCACCSVSVHAECYKLRADARSGVGGWLCAVCEYERASGVTVCNRSGNVDCELCPANGGAYFASADTAGHFVHAVCALYTAGVRFVTEEHSSGKSRRRRGATESQSGSPGAQQQQHFPPTVSLQDVTALRRSAMQRSCALCDDLRFSWTGAPIACDAGLCRAAFHATCAQRAGLLVELHTVHLRPRDAPATEPAADNVAYCRLHSNPEDVRRRRRAFVACAPYATIEQDFDRFAFLNVAPAFGRVTPVSVSCRSDDDAPRLLHSSAPLIKRFYRKAALLEHQLPTAALPTRAASEAAADARGVRCVRKADLHVVASAQLLKANCAFSALPTFTPAFVERYFERNELIAEEQERLVKAIDERRQLREQEIGLSDLYNTLVESAREERTRTAQLCEMLKQLRAGVCGFSLNIADPVISDALDAQQARTSRQVATKRPAATKGENRPVAAKQRRAAFDGASESESATASVGPDGGSLFRACCVCSLMTGQHLLVQCDTCRLYYHLACLEPPLSRMPKKSRIYGWQCSRCTLRRACDSDDEKSGANVDVNQPRQLRHAHAPNDADTDA